MKKLIFYRSFKGSFSLKNSENSPLYLEAPQLQVPLFFSCGFQQPIDKESGMSVSLIEVDKAINLLNKSFSLLVFNDLADVFIKANLFFKNHSPEFQELLVSDRLNEISLKDKKYNLCINMDKILKIDQVSDLPFFTKTKYGFQFLTEKEAELFFHNELPTKLSQIKNIKSHQDPFTELKDLKHFYFQAPKSLNWIETGKGFFK